MILSEPVLLLVGDISTLGEFVFIFFLTKQLFFGVFYSHILKNNSDKLQDIFIPYCRR
jgi:hypothetical protein